MGDTSKRQGGAYTAVLRKARPSLERTASVVVASGQHSVARPVTDATAAAQGERAGASMKRTRPCGIFVICRRRGNARTTGVIVTVPRPLQTAEAPTAVVSAVVTMRDAGPQGLYEASRASEIIVQWHRMRQQGWRRRAHTVVGRRVGRWGHG